MKIMRYLIIGLTMTVSGTAFCAEVALKPSETETKQKAETALTLVLTSEEELNKKLHGAKTIAEAEEALAQGARLEMPLLEQKSFFAEEIHPELTDLNLVDIKWAKQLLSESSYDAIDYRFLPCTLVNCERDPALIDFVVKKGNIPVFPCILNSLGKHVALTVSTPLFSMFFLFQHWKKMPLNKLSQKCKKLIEAGVPLAARIKATYRWIDSLEKKPSHLPVEEVLVGDSFADLASFDKKYARMQLMLKPEDLRSFVCMCKAIYDAQVGRDATLKKDIREALPKFSYDITDTLILGYVCDEAAELKKLKAILDDPRAKKLLRAKEFLNEIAQYNDF